MYSGHQPENMRSCPGAVTGESRDTDLTLMIGLADENVR